MDSSTQQISQNERQHAAARIDLEARVAQAAETFFDELKARGLWQGDAKRVAGTVGRYSLSLLERGWVKSDAAAA
jgi:hypothetical protein